MNTLEKLGAFNVWANATLLERLTQVAGTGKELPGAVLRLFSHVLNAQAIWIARLNGTASPVKVWQEHDLPTCQQLHAQTSEPLHQLMARADDAEDRRRAHVVLEHVERVGEHHRQYLRQHAEADALQPVAARRGDAVDLLAVEILDRL